MATHVHMTHDGRKVQYDDVTGVSRAYIRRGHEWARTSMKPVYYQILLKELLEKIQQPKIPNLIRLVRNAGEEA